MFGFQDLADPEADEDEYDEEGDEEGEEDVGEDDPLVDINQEKEEKVEAEKVEKVEKGKKVEKVEDSGPEQKKDMVAGKVLNPGPENMAAGKDPNEAQPKVEEKEQKDRGDAEPKPSPEQKSEEGNKTERQSSPATQTKAPEASQAALATAADKTNPGEQNLTSILVASTCMTMHLSKFKTKRNKSPCLCVDIAESELSQACN